LTRGSDYTLEYACTIRVALSPAVLAQMKSVLAKAAI
jgi:hypothetical protein